MNIAFENGYGTSKNDKIKFSKSSVVTLGNGETQLDLLAGTNSIQTEANSWVNLRMNVKNLNTLTVASGAVVDKVQGYTIFSAQDITTLAKAAKISIGNYAIVNFANILSGDAADNITIGKYSNFTAGDINLDAGKNVFSIGSCSTVNLNSLLGEFGKLSIANGIKNKDGKITESQLIVENNVVGSDEKTNNLSIGNYAVMQAKKILFGSANDKISIGTDSDFAVENIDFGDGSDTMTVGGRSTAKINGNIEGVSTLTVSNGSYDKKNDETNWTRLTAGNVTGTAETASTYSFGNYNDVDLKNITTQNKNDQIKIGSDSKFTAGIIDLGTGSNSMTIGSRSIVNVGDVSSLNKLTVSNASYYKKTKLSAGNFTATTGNDTFSFGNYCDANLKSIEFEAGNDTLKIGNYSDVNISGIIDFSNGKNTVQIGNYSDVVLKSNSAGTVTKFTIGKESEAYLSSELYKAVTKADKTADVYDIGSFDVAKNFTSIDDEQSDDVFADARTLDSADYNGWLCGGKNELDLADFFERGTAENITKVSATDNLLLSQFDINGEQIGDAVSFTDTIAFAANATVFSITLANEDAKATSYKMQLA